MKTEEIAYEHEGQILKGFLAYEDSSTEKRPGILVAHAWGGRDNFACEKAKKLAEQGYVGFALDMYGGAQLGKDKDENAKLMGPFVENREFLRSRMKASLEMLKKQPLVDKSRIAAIGYCFGGLCVLDLARTGEALNGVVSFHGLLGAPENIPTQKIKAKVLALHGFDDPMVPPEQMVTFGQEMTKAQTDWQVHIYGNNMHAFTNPEANDPGFGTVYNKKADERSWLAMENFFGEIFSAPL